MKRSTLNLIIDAAALAGFVLLTTTGLLLHYILPHGSGNYLTIWALNRHEWASIHFWISVVFLILLAIHVVLHWSWIINIITRRYREGSSLRVGIGIVAILVLVAFSISPLITPVEKTLKRTSDNTVMSDQKQENVHIRGSMTLMDVEKVYGIPIKQIIEKLKLPISISSEERIGTLKRTYGFTTSDIRDVIREHNYKE